MVLCPYVFVLTQHDIPPLRLQPTEVGSAHWVSIRALLSTSQRTFEYQNVSNRLAGRGSEFRRILINAMLGRMIFGAIRLIPSESLYCSSIPGFIPGASEESATSHNAVLNPFNGWKSAPTHAASTDKPLLLWGLTLGIIADFFELFPFRSDKSFWVYPTFTPWDLRFTLWLLSSPFRKRQQRPWKIHRQRMLSALHEDRTRSGPEARDSEDRGPSIEEAEAPSLKIANREEKQRDLRYSPSSAVSDILDGYNRLVRKAVMITLFSRAVVVVAVVGGLYYRRFIRAPRTGV